MFVCSAVVLDDSDDGWRLLASASVTFVLLCCVLPEAQMSVNMKCLCWGSPLYCQQGVFGFALKPFVGLFDDGPSSKLCRGPGKVFFFLSFFFVFECVSSSLPMQVWGCADLLSHPLSVGGPVGGAR